MRDWEAGFLRRDADNLLAMLWTWQNADISDNPFIGATWLRRSVRSRRALSSCQARPIYIFPSRTAGAMWPSCRTLNCSRSRRSGGIGSTIRVQNPADAQFVDAALKQLLLELISSSGYNSEACPRDWHATRTLNHATLDVDAAFGIVLRADSCVWRRASSSANCGHGSTALSPKPQDKTHVDTPPSHQVADGRFGVDGRSRDPQGAVGVHIPHRRPQSDHRRQQLRRRACRR